MGKSKRQTEQETVRFMVGLYCNDHHGTGKGQLCAACQELADYAHARVEHCPNGEDKNFCSVCPHPCYQPAMREQIREVMRYSGPRMIRYRPIMALRHVITMKRQQRAL